MSGLFATFNIAKSGMFVQQKAIDVTTHNIANANTEGYSRQRAIIQTSEPFGMPSLNSTSGPGQMGTGAQIAAIQRVRDSFVDYQVRAENTTLGQYQAKDTFLSEVENIFNEPSDTGLSSLMGKFFSAWQDLSLQPQSSNTRTVVAQQAAALTDELNHTYNQLQKIKENVQSVMKDSLFEASSQLKQIDDLNQQIISVKVGGQEPNDLLDRRDNLVDALSLKFGLTVDNKSFSGIDIKPVPEVDPKAPNNVLDFENNLPQNPLLIKSTMNDEVKRFAYISTIDKVQDNSGKTIDGEYKIVYYKNGDLSSDKNRREMYISGVDSDAYKKIEECRTLWTDTDGNALSGNEMPINDSTSESPVNYASIKLFKPQSGELKGYISVQNDVDSYMDQLNRVAKAVAFSVNALHSGKTTVPPDIDSEPFFVNGDIAKYDSSSSNTLTNLSDTLAAEEDITAGNISVNKNIITDVMQIKVRTNDDKFDHESENDIDGEKDGARALAIAQLKDKLMKIQSINATNGIINRGDLFSNDTLKGGNTLNGVDFGGNTEGMTVGSYFKDTVDRLGIEEQEAKRMVTNQEDLLDGLKESRESVSGVSLDEEMANMIQFQHAYQANAKIISVVDQLLDVVVNGLIK